MNAGLTSKPKLRVVSDSIPRPTPNRNAPIKPRRIDTYNSHPAVGLTVDMLLSFYRDAERGMPVRQYDCFDDLIETDGHLRSHYNGRIEAVAGCEMMVKPGRSDKPSEFAAAALQERLGELSFREMIEHQLTAPHYGIACTNIVWDVVDGVIAPIEFVNAAHRRFAAPDQDHASEIWMIDGDNTRDLVALEPGLWAVSRYRGRNPYACGIMRTAAWWAMVKRWAVRDWQVFAEMFGLPLSIGYYEEGASEASRMALGDAVKSIGEDGYAVLSQMTEIVIKDTARSGDSSTVYPKIIDLAEAQIAKLFAGGTLNSDVAGTGSYNAASVHESRGYKLERADARRIEGMFERDIGRVFCAWNKFDRAAAPHLSIKITRDNLDRAKSLEIVGQVIELDEDQIREEFSLRVPANGKGVKFSKSPAPAGKTPGAPPL